MKTIYKSIALEAALLSVTIALQAEIQSEGETVTADVQASSLDRLKVTLVSPNVSGARDLVASGNAVIEGNEIAVSLENLAFGTHRLVVSARFGTQIRTLYALDISVPQAELPNETQEYEDTVTVVSTYGDGGGGGEFPTDYAKQGDDPTATLTDTQAYAQAAAEAAQSITSLDSDINAGKTAIAAAVTVKGVPTSPTDTMLQMATNVTQITQAPISINGGEMYAKQLYGSLTTPNYWNLYEVMAQLLSDGRLSNYGGILLAEYYKGYDSLALFGAGAGGAYVVSDVDSNGNFILYTEDVTHTWSDQTNLKGNRWVAYCFANENHPYSTDVDTNKTPRSIHIGRKVGIISFAANTRIAEIVVAATGASLQDIVSGTYAAQWNKHIVLRGLQEHTSGILVNNAADAESVYIQLARYNALVHANNGLLAFTEYTNKLSSIIVECDEWVSGGLFGNNSYGLPNLSEIIIKGQSINAAFAALFPRLTSLKTLTVIASSLILNYNQGKQISNHTLVLNYLDKNGSFSILGQDAEKAIDVILQDEWCMDLDVHSCTYLTEANMYAHILQRLKQDEPDCGDGVTITLGQTNLDKLTSQESIDLLDTLTNTYGYTFA